MLPPTVNTVTGRLMGNRNAGIAIFLAAPLLVLAYGGVVAQERIGGRLSAALQRSGPEDEIVVWVYFADKGSSEILKRSVPKDVVSERSLERRRKVLPEATLVDYADLPVDQQYVQELSRHVQRVRQQSKWFNAASVVATPSQVTQIEALPFVRKVDLVTRFRKDPVDHSSSLEADQNGAEQSHALGKAHDLDYGASLGQLSQINVPAVHNMGNYGQGVVVGVFDNGFRLLTHEVFGNLNILATRDFVDHKSSVVPNGEYVWDATESKWVLMGEHGVETLSTIGGYKPGQLIGPAFGATYILLRTENDSSETPVEEDNWVAGIEWADSLGVQVTSTSLGYLDYDSPYPSWTWQDMDGRTTVISRAAAMAVRKGIVVVNSAGNNGSNPNHNTLNAPADADSVISVGAVDGNGSRTYFSSVGPTTSIPARIKPDIMAQGTSVRVASPTLTTGYTYSQGTSFSCPLAAGVAALILHAHPDATPVEVADALRSTGSRSSAPDNLYGWGIIDAMAAITSLGTEGGGQPRSYILEQNYPNPFNPLTRIRFEVFEEGHVTLRVFNTLGEQVAELLNEARPAGPYTLQFSGAELPSGVYFYRMIAGGHSETKKMVLMR
jgi:serine protease AprX